MSQDFDYFNTQPPEGGWSSLPECCNIKSSFQHTAARRRLVRADFRCRDLAAVSTHSRPKAAGAAATATATAKKRFNTQPPEGGWGGASLFCQTSGSFNTQPPEGGWTQYPTVEQPPAPFQHTAARRRLGLSLTPYIESLMFQHTAARRRLDDDLRELRNLAAVSTHSRPKAAGCSCKGRRAGFVVSTHSRPKAAGSGAGRMASGKRGFQHTAARRRLADLAYRFCMAACFNTQPPEGGWHSSFNNVAPFVCFNTQPPEGGWSRAAFHISARLLFQHTAARRRLVLIVLICY